MKNFYNKNTFLCGIKKMNIFEKEPTEVPDLTVIISFSSAFHSTYLNIIEKQQKIFFRY